MTGPHEQPDDDVLLELGKLTWTAINFEDVVYFVCQCIDPTNDYRGTATGTRIKQGTRGASNPTRRGAAEESRSVARGRFTGPC